MIYFMNVLFFLYTLYERCVRTQMLSKLQFLDLNCYNAGTLRCINMCKGSEKNLLTSNIDLIILILSQNKIHVEYSQISLLKWNLM